MATAPNLGTGGTALDAQFGSSPTSNTNEPLLLAHTGTNYVYIPGLITDLTNYVSVPDSAALSITGDIDIKAWVALDDWTPSLLSGFVGKWVEAGNQRSYLFAVNPDSTLILYTSVNGISQISSTSTVATGLADGTLKWVRVTMDVNDGAGNRVVKFYTSDDGTTWTQLGATVTTAGATSIFDSTAPLEISAVSAGGSFMGGKVYRVIVQNAYDTANNTSNVVLDANFTTGITSGGQTSFTESSANAATVTINRSSSGRKSVAVVRPVWLLGADDYFEVADNDLLDFTNTQDFSLVSVIRAWGTTADDTIVAKKTSTAAGTVGYALEMSTSSATTGRLSDGTTQHSPTATTRTAGALTVLSLVRSGTTVTAYHNATAGTPVSITATGTFSNSEVMRIGRLSGAGTNYLDAELVAAMVFRRALSSTELAQIATYYGVA